MEAYFDAEAALKFVLSQGIPKEKVIAHGYSLGGAYAAALGCFFGVKTLVLNHTFTSCGAVMSNVTPFSQNISEHLVHKAYEQKVEKKDETIPGAKDLKTDGFNSLAKVAQMQGANVFVIRGQDDKLMNMEFGEQLIKAAYPGDPQKQKDYLATVAGGHCNIENFETDKTAQEQFKKFLQNSGLAKFN